MSRTKIYVKMDETALLLIGSNAFANEFSKFNDGVGDFNSASVQSSDVVQDQFLCGSELTDLDIASLLDGNNCTYLNDVNNVNSNEILDTSLFEKEYSLDEIIDDNAAYFSGSETMSPYMGTPVASPLSATLDMSLEGLLNNCNTEKDAVFPQINSDLQNVNDISCPDLVLGSPDSGFASSEELCSDSNDLIFQLLGNALRANSSGKINETPSEMTSEEDAFNDVIKELFEASSNEGDNEKPTKRFVERAHPYKKKTKTDEQKQRKKAQNRNAAVRYRCKKKDELKTMLDEEEKLRVKNTELKGKVQGLRKEVDYLKTLMLDVIKARLAKGQNNPKAFESLLQSNLIQA